MAEVEALLVSDTRGHFRRGKIARRACNPNDVCISIHYAGICHSDYHSAKGEWAGKNIYPMVPGHEIAGVVEAIGNKVTKYKVGDKVGVGCFVDSCRSCEMCKLGDEQYCQSGMIATYNTHLDPKYQLKNHIPSDHTLGGYSQKIVVDENYVLRIPDSLPLEHSAPLLCAGITCYSPLSYYGAKSGGKNFKTAIVGLGGLGDMGVKLAKAMGNEVTVISSSERKREYVEKTLGVQFINSGRTSETLAAMVKKYSNSFDLILCTISSDFELSPYLNLVKTNGKFCLLGAPANNLSFNAFEVIFRRKQIVGSLIGGIKETQEMLDFCGKYGLWPEVEHIKASEVNRAYMELSMNNAAKQRFVIDVKDSLIKGEWSIDNSFLKNTAKHTVNKFLTVVGAENTAGKTYYPDTDKFV